MKTEIIATIDPETLAERPPLPYRARCLTPGCSLADSPVTAKYEETAQMCAEAHVYAFKHRVVIERVSCEAAP